MFSQGTFGHITYIAAVCGGLLDLRRTHLQLEDTYLVAVSLQYEDARYAIWNNTDLEDTYSSRHIAAHTYSSSIWNLRTHIFRR